MSLLQDFLLEKLPTKRKLLPSGWVSYNCPCCTNRGASKPDNRARGGLFVEGDGSLFLNCFNCGFHTGWKPGMKLTEPIKFYLRSLGCAEDELKKISFKLWQLKENIKAGNKINLDQFIYQSFPEKRLPNGARSFKRWADEPNPPKEFLDVLTYIAGRGTDILENFDFHWTPDTKNDMNKRVIIPFYHRDKIVGYTARSILPDTKIGKYYGDEPANFLFNNKVMDHYTRPYIILAEGPFDAIAIDGVACLGNKLNKEQIQWINRSNKEVIVVLDKDPSGGSLLKIALNEGWSTSHPRYMTWWDENIKDIAEATNIYGRLFVLKSILDSKKNRLQTQVFWKTKIEQQKTYKGNK